MPRSPYTPAQRSIFAQEMADIGVERVHRVRAKLRLGEAVQQVAWQEMVSIGLAQYLLRGVQRSERRVLARQRKAELAGGAHAGAANVE